MFRIIRSKTLGNLKTNLAELATRLGRKSEEVEDLTHKLASTLGDVEEQKTRTALMARWLICVLTMEGRTYRNLPASRLQRAAVYDLAVRKDVNWDIRVELVGKTMYAGLPNILESVGQKEVVSAKG